MKLPFLLLDRVGLKESAAEKAIRRARALAERAKQARFEQMLREEVAQMEDLRHIMTTAEYPKLKRRWSMAAK